MLKPFIKSVFALFLLLQPFSAGAYVVQDSQSALSFNNVSRSIAASSSAAQSSGKETSEGKVFDDKVDYEEISAKLFDKSSRKVYIDLSQNSTKNIKMPQGYVFHLILPEEEGSSWHVDCNENIIKPVSTRREGTNRIIEFQAVRTGNARIFLDNICRKNRGFKVIQSRIIRVKVTG